MNREGSDEPEEASGGSGGVVDEIIAGELSESAARERLNALADGDEKTVQQEMDALTAFVANDRGDAAVEDRLSAISLLAEFATAHPEHASAVVSALAGSLDDPVTETTSLRALARIVNETPCAVDPVLDPVAERVTENPLPARQNAVRILQRRASGDPEAVAPHVSRLVDAVVSTEGMNTGRVDLPDYKQSELEDQSMAEERLRQRTASILQELASARPEAVAPALPRLLAPVDPARARNVHLKEQLLDVARTVTATASDAALERIDTLYAVVEDDDAPQALRANAAGTLAAVADSHIEAVTVPGESAIPALGDLLAADDPAVRANAGSLLSYVAQQYPSATASLTDTLVGRLDDENVAVRSSVVWTLAYVDTEPAREALRRVADEDPNPDVRGLATELLTSGPGA